MISFRYNVDALAQLVVRLKDMPPMAKAVARRSARRQAQAILLDAQDNYVPEGEGDLREDAGVDDLSSGSTVRLVVWFGRDKAKAYALAVHEHLSEHSPSSWKKAETGVTAVTRGGKAVKIARNSAGQFRKHGVHFIHGGPKYLELPAMKGEEHFLEQISNDVGTALSLPDSWRQFAEIAEE